MNLSNKSNLHEWLYLFKQLNIKQIIHLELKGFFFQRDNFKLGNVRHIL